jgi:hypothetical protein
MLNILSFFLNNSKTIASGIKTIFESEVHKRTPLWIQAIAVIAGINFAPEQMAILADYFIHSGVHINKNIAFAIVIMLFFFKIGLNVALNWKFVLIELWNVIMFVLNFLVFLIINPKILITNFKIYYANSQLNLAQKKQKLQNIKIKTIKINKRNKNV